MTAGSEGKDNGRQQWILAVTGASGAPLALRLFERMTAAPAVHVSLIVSDNARAVLRAESDPGPGRGLEGLRMFFDPLAGNRPYEVLEPGDFCAGVASGTAPVHGMIIAPCSMSSLGAIANGITLNLIHRAASVMLKERRPLILVPRETPLSAVHCRNLLELSRAGAHIAPACLGFYFRPKTVGDLVDSVCMKVLDLAGIPHGLDFRWKGQGR